MDNYKDKTFEIIFKRDTAVVSDYGEPTKTLETVEVRALIGAPEDLKPWADSGIYQEADLVALVFEDFTANLDGEFFTDPDVNILALIGTIYYRIISIQSPESIHSEVPYWRIFMSKLQHSPN